MRKQPKESVTGIRAAVQFLLVTIALAVLHAPAFSAGREDVFKLSPNLLGILRVNRLFDAGDKVENFFSELNPNIRDLDPKSPLRKPVQALVGSFIRNASLDDIDEKSYLELLILNTTTPDDSPYAAAFLLNEDADYRRLLSRQASLREEATTDEITKYREESRESTTFLYLTIVHNRVGIIGTSREVVRQARESYLQFGIKGLVEDRGEDMVLSLDAYRTMRIFDERIRASLRQLKEDILRDVNGEESQNQELGFSLMRSFDATISTLRQFNNLDMRVIIRPEEIITHVEAKMLETGWLKVIMQKSPSKKIPTLAEALPSSCLSFRDTVIWPDLWSSLLRTIGSVAGHGMSGVIGQDVEGQLDSLLARINSASPLEVASGIVPPRIENPKESFVHVFLSKWENADKTEDIFNAAENLLKPGPVAELLEQNGIMVLTKRRPGIVKVDGIPVEWIELYPRLQLNSSFAGEIGLWKKPRRYLIARSNNLMAVVTSNTLVSAEKVSSGGAKRELEILSTVLTSGEKNALSGNKEYKEIMRDAKKYGAFGISWIKPLSYLQLAVEDLAHANRNSATDASSTWRYAEEFREFGASDFPVSWITGLGMDSVFVRVKVPLRAVQKLTRACLGISVSGSAKANSEDL